MLCLGIESTAHTFSIGIVSDQGLILSMISKTYKPMEGGLKPADVAEHHYASCDQVLHEALRVAQKNLAEIELIAFSQGPGLGPCLRIGAMMARTLSLRLNIPIVGVNHCIAHVEIGRLLCHITDPLTVYVSGGNTIISAFESQRYQIFGETMDLPLGNMLDMLARELQIPYPGGPRIEQLARQGTQFLMLPYLVKGMDLSFSGLFTIFRQILRKNSPLNIPLDYQSKNLHYADFPQFSLADLVFSTQEIAFSMLTEVTERGLAHTEKPTVLLTGGVAANKRLQEMIRIVCQDHHTAFHVVPREYAGDNGVMIAWTGIIQHKVQGGHPIEHTSIIPKWRMDQVSIPWRNDIEVANWTISPPSPLEIRTENTIIGDIKPSSSGQVIQIGAEATLIRLPTDTSSVLLKSRIPKRYRESILDASIRFTRTVLEARALIDLHADEIPVPCVYGVDPYQGQITLEYIHGNRLKDLIPQYSSTQLDTIFHQIGMWVAAMHTLNYMHGDITTSNILITPNRQLVFIDFGLAQKDLRIEDMAMDLHLFKRVVISSHGDFFSSIYPAFIRGYREQGSKKGLDVTSILSRIDKIEIRGRYIPKADRREE